MHTLYLSPHFDDIVLSCGGHLWQQLRGGHKATVVTIFGGMPSAAEVWPFAQVQHQMWGHPPDPIGLRRAEDRAALSRLGLPDTAIVHLEYRDAIYRGEGGRPFYDAEEKIFGQVARGEAMLPTQIAETVLEQVVTIQQHEGVPPTIYAPLGIGNHVDHQLTVAAARLLLDRGLPVVWYEEAPYIFDPRQQLTLPSGAGWRSQTILLGETAMAAKVAAMSYYRSQISVLFGDDLAMSRDLRAYAAMIAPPTAAYGERFWDMENPDG